jgi:hypothetical protein
VVRSASAGRPDLGTTRRAARSGFAAAPRRRDTRRALLWFLERRHTWPGAGTRREVAADDRPGPDQLHVACQQLKTCTCTTWMVVYGGERMAVWEPGSILVLVRGGMAQVDCAVRLCCMWVNFFDCLQNSSFYLRAFSIEMVRNFLLRLLQYQPQPVQRLS